MKRKSKRMNAPAPTAGDNEGEPYEGEPYVPLVGSHPVASSKARFGSLGGDDDGAEDDEGGALRGKGPTVRATSLDVDEPEPDFTDIPPALGPGDYGGLGTTSG